MSSETPPSHTVDPIEAPPPSAEPTTAQLKAEIDSGRTGDKVSAYDPGLSPLGTDDEAAGHPPGPDRVAIARRSERIERWIKGARKVGYAHRAGADPALAFYIGFIVVAGLVLVGGIAFA